MISMAPWRRCALCANSPDYDATKACFGFAGLRDHPVRGGCASRDGRPQLIYTAANLAGNFYFRRAQWQTELGR
jgi:hypothetical protein